MMARPLWKRLALLCGALMGLGFAFPAQAQLDIFENNNQEPPGRRGFTFGPIKLNKQAGSREMARGNTFYADKNYAAASLMFYRVVKDAAGSRYFQAAQFQLALSLYRMGLFHAALDYFTDIIRAGANHRYFKRALTYSITVSRKLQNESMFLGKLRSFNVSDFPNQYRDELLYLLGKYYYLREDLSIEKRLPLAQRLLNRVRSQKPEFYARAQYILGAIYDTSDRAELAGKSAQAFKRAARAAMRIQDKEMRQRVFELGIMGIARIHYSAKHFGGSTYWYQAIPRNSPRWLDALFEMSWAFLRRGKYEETLGIIHTLRSPYFKNEYYPEVGILQAVSFFERCRYTEVKKIVQDYLTQYRPLVASLNSFLQRNPNDEAMYKALSELRNQQEEKTKVAGLEDDPSEQMFQRILNLTFRDKPLQVLFSYIKELEGELAIIQQSSQAWQQSAIGLEMAKRLREERVKKIKEAGARARERILKAQTELQGLIGQALKIQYETLSAQKERINKAANESGGFTMRVKGQENKDRKLISVSVADDFTFWPFQNEYWIDELGYYRYRIKGECHR